MELRQGPLGLQVRHRRATASPSRWCATTTATSSRRAGPRRSRSRRGGLAAARTGAGVGVLTGGRLTVEDAYAYAKFARVVLGTNDIDFRARERSRPRSATFLAARSPAASWRRPTPTSRPRRPSCSSGSSRGGVADRLPAAAQGRAQPRRCRSFGIAPFATDRVRKACGRPCCAPRPAPRPTVLDAPSPTRTRPRRCRQRLRRRAAQAGGGDPRRRAAGRGARCAVGCGRGSPTRPAPSWPGCRVGPVTAVRSRPAALPALLPGGRPRGTRRRGAGWRAGASDVCPATGRPRRRRDPRGRCRR